MQCFYCRSQKLVKNGLSRHGNQRWICRDCGKTCGRYDKRKISDDLRTAALEGYMGGMGLRATERKIGVNHNAVMQWVLQAAKNALVARSVEEKVEWMAAEGLKSAVKEKLAGRSGFLVILPEKFAAGQWAVITPKKPSTWMRKFILGARAFPVSIPNSQ